MEITLSKALVMRKRTYQKIRKSYESFTRNLFLPTGTEVKPEHVSVLKTFTSKEEKLKALYTELSVKIQQSNVSIASELVELELTKTKHKELQRMLYQVESNNRYNTDVRPVCLLDVTFLEQELSKEEEKIENLQDRIAEFNIRTKITIPDELIV